MTRWASGSAIIFGLGAWFFAPSVVGAQERIDRFPTRERVSANPRATLDSRDPDRGFGSPPELGLIAITAGLVALSLVVTDAPALDCSPCDRRDVPGFDRWAIGDSRTGIADASTVLLGALGGLTLLDLYGGSDEPGLSHAVASVEAAALAYAITLNLKEIAGRRRPFVFSEDVSALGGFREGEATKSFPSGHASIAFALGVSYLRTRGGEAGTLAKVMTVVSMVGVGVGRVAARYHFPSDVFAGAALGSASAWLVHEIRF
jgi:membrane-associated phospholipid phosphatase